VKSGCKSNGLWRVLTLTTTLHKPLLLQALFTNHYSHKHSSQTITLTTTLHKPLLLQALFTNHFSYNHSSQTTVWVQLSWWLVTIRHLYRTIKGTFQTKVFSKHSVSRNYLLCRPVNSNYIHGKPANKN
jgi:hypothetical protein